MDEMERALAEVAWKIDWVEGVLKLDGPLDEWGNPPPTGFSEGDEDVLLDLRRGLREERAELELGRSRLRGGKPRVRVEALAA